MSMNQIASKAARDNNISVANIFWLPAVSDMTAVIKGQKDTWQAVVDAIWDTSRHPSLNQIHAELWAMDIDDTPPALQMINSQGFIVVLAMPILESVRALDDVDNGFTFTRSTSEFDLEVVFVSDLSELPAIMEQVGSDYPKDILAGALAPSQMAPEEDEVDA